MMSLERPCPTAAHWAERQYQELFHARGNGPERLVLVAEPSFPNEIPDAAPGIVGFLVARHLAPEWELENIVVAPAARRKGLGKRLLDALLARAREAHSHSVFLEVRNSNFAARALYEKAGFQQTGRRKAYYADPPEDAILCRLDLG